MMMRRSPQAVWCESAHNAYAVGLVPHGPVVLLANSSALVWEEICLQPGAFEPTDIAESIIDLLAEAGGGVDPATIRRHTAEFVAELLRQRLLVLDEPS